MATLWVTVSTAPLVLKRNHGDVSPPTVLRAAAPAAAERVPGVSVHHGNAAQASGKSAVVPHHLQS